MQTVKIRCRPYASNSVFADLDVPAHVVGDIAIHRPTSYAGGREPLRLGKKGWNVSHIPTRAPVDNVRPRNLRYTGHLRELKAWAARWQELAPDEFAALRAMAPGDTITDKALAQRLMDAAAKAGEQET